MNLVMGMMRFFGMFKYRCPIAAKHEPRKEIIIKAASVSQALLCARLCSEPLVWWEWWISRGSS